jgi:cell division septal protein FtsQ
MSKKRSLRKKHCIKRKKSLFENNIIYGSFISLFLFSFGVYLFIFHPLFQVSSVVIESSENINEKNLVDYVNQKIQRKLFFLNSKSIFLFSEDKTQNEVLSQISTIKDISIEKVFPGEIKIKFVERTPALICCKEHNTKYCYYLDREGIAFQKFNNVKKNLFLIIKKGEYLLGDKVLSKNCIESIFFLINELRRLKIETNYINLEKEDTITLITKDRWNILFSLENYEKELKNLKLILEKIDEDKMQDLDYIDLRFGDRIYYK